MEEDKRVCSLFFLGGKLREMALSCIWLFPPRGGGGGRGISCAIGYSGLGSTLSCFWPPEARDVWRGNGRCEL